MIKKILILFFFIINASANSDGTLININLSNECKNDIFNLCHLIKNGSNLEILLCLQKSEHLTKLISKPCQHYLWEFKKSFLNSNYFNSFSNDNCKDEMDRFTNCRSKKKDDKVICLIKHKSEIKNQLCAMYVDEAVSIIFTDIFLINNFLNECSDDVSNLKCGRLEGSINVINVDSVNLTSQVSTINCLIDSLEKVQLPCRKQILRLGEIQSDDFHHNPALFYACQEDRELFCANVNSGNSQVYQCLEKFKEDDKMSRNCREELNKKQKLEGFDYKIRQHFSEKCAKDINNHKCVTSSDNINNMALSTIILCLVKADHQESEEIRLEPHCRAEVLLAREQLAKNPQMSTEVVTKCNKEIQMFCSEINTKIDDIIHCLLQNRLPALEGNFSKGCTVALNTHFKVVDPTEDIAQLDPVISQACSDELRTKCSNNDIKHADDRYECLLQQIDLETSEQKMNEDCKTALLTLTYFIERDYSLNHKLYKSCRKDANKFCKVINKKEIDEESLVPHAILHCLIQRWSSTLRKSILSYKCEMEIKSVMKIEASSVKLNFRIYSSCFGDIMKLCKEDSYKIDCLQLKYHKLQEVCKNSIIEFLSLDKEEYSLKKLIARSCSPMVRMFCKNEMNAKEKNFMNCLVQYKYDTNMDKNCKIAIEHYQIISLDNYKINQKFARLCSNEIKEFCGGLVPNLLPISPVKEDNEEEDTAVTEKSITKNDVISCLSRKLTLSLLQNQNPFSSQCYEQFTFEFLQIGSSINLDPALQKNCEIDIGKWCTKIDSDKVLSCLQKYQDSLSDLCYKILVSRQQLSALDNQLDGGLQRYCKEMIEVYCGNQLMRKIFRCLHINMRLDGFNKRCKKEVLYRLQRRLVEIKLNPDLIDNCKKEVQVFCNVTAVIGYIAEMHHDKKIDIVTCLRLKFLEDKTLLSANCRHLVYEIVLDAHANIRLDPNLYDNCKGYIKQYCSKEIGQNEVYTDGRVQDCLKHNFLGGKIKTNSCYYEIHRLLREGNADVHVDVQLYNACSEEISRICFSEQLGLGKKLSCLLWAIEDKRTLPFLSEGCKSVLLERKLMWEYASKIEPPENIKEVFALMSESRSRYYFVLIASILFLVVLTAGMIFGRVTKKTQVLQKRR